MERRHLRASIRFRVPVMRWYLVLLGRAAKHVGRPALLPGSLDPAAGQAGTPCGSSSRLTEHTAARPARLAPMVLADGP